MGLAARPDRYYSRDFGWYFRRPVEELRPRRNLIFSGIASECGDLHAGSGATLTRDTSVYETQGGSLKFTVPPDSEKWCYADLPEDVYARGEVRYRMRSPDWTRFKCLLLALFETAEATSNFHYIEPVYDSGATVYDRYGIATTPWPADTWRWLPTIGPQYKVQGTPTAWGDMDVHAYKKIRRVGLDLKTTAAGEGVLYLDRIEAPEWPCGFFCLNLDGYQTGADVYVSTPFLARKWRHSASVLAYYSGGNPKLPTPAAVQSAIAAGVDFSIHGKKENGTSFAVGTTEAEVEAGIYYNTKVYAASVANGFDRSFLHALLGNQGSTTSCDTAGAMERAGVLASRGSTSDLLYGVKSGLDSPPMTSLFLTTNDNVLGPVVPLRGPYNFGNDPQGLHNGDWATTWSSRLATAIRWRLVMQTYLHAVLESPGPSDYSIANVAAMIDDLAANEQYVEFATIRDLFKLAYARPDELYCDRYGDWRARW
jgi:hypothetical protein